MGKSQREKGKRFERLVASQFRAIGFDAKRGWQCRSGDDAPDVDIPYWWVECKHHRKVPWRAAYKQACESRDSRAPIAVCKDDKADAVVIMGARDFFELVEEWLERGEK